MYKENPKTKGSGIYAVIPQTGHCPNNCEDCFFQSGRSFLVKDGGTLEENLPNLYDYKYLEEMYSKVFRINDGNDSNVDRETVMEKTGKYLLKFYNTAIPRDLEEFDAPFVLTINPGFMTDRSWHKLIEIPKNLMFVRIRTNCWNLEQVVKPAVKYYTEKEVPVVLTFMAYFDTPIPEGYEDDYIFRKRTLNSYNAITTQAWEEIMRMFKYNAYVYSCGKIEGEKGTTKCARCGNCIREFFVTMERMKDEL